MQNNNQWQETEVPGLFKKDPFCPPLDENEVAIIEGNKVKRYWVKVIDPSDPITRAILSEGKRGIHVE